MKQVTHNDHTIGGCLLYFAIIILTALIMASCCREATEWNVRRWENKTKFRSNKPITYKKSYVKYPKQKKQLIIKYKQ